MKTLNVFGIILAWILSIALVLMLIAAPLTLSALSLLDADNIAELVGDALVSEAKPAAAQPAYAVQMLSAEAELPAEEPAANDILGSMDLEGIVGEQLDEEVLNKILQSNAASELLDAYMGDVTNAITGKPGEKQFTAEKLVEVVRDNADEIVQIVEESGVTLTEEEKAQLKTEIQAAVEENAETIIAEIPTPEEIKETLIDENEGLELAFGILAAKKQIKTMLIGAIVVLSLLIFGLRYPGFRGLRWLSTDLFTAGGFNILICVVLGFGASVIKGFTDAADSAAMDGVIGTLLSRLTTGVVVRTVIIFAAAIALLVGYILLKKFVVKKPAAQGNPIPAPAPVYTDAPAAETPAETPETAEKTEEN